LNHCRLTGEEGESYDEIIRKLLSKIIWKKRTEDGIKYRKKTSLFLCKSYDFPCIYFQNLPEQFYYLPEEMQRRIHAGLKALMKEPFKARSSADIKASKGHKTSKISLKDRRLQNNILRGI